ncbi:MAG: RNA polymerase sigma-70 factor [Chloroflexi bacterium]|nr:MAG: RNA polymerase sigma-70 factor [Chloroflexota bacterium]
MAEQDPTASVFEEQRSYLFSIAYRLLGSVSDAEDIVQDAFLRWDREPLPDLRSPRAYLTTIVVRLCLDQLRSARAKREIYVGPWLPEPLITTGRTDLTDSLVLRESLSFAFLLMLENLSPLERAVFVLREVFDYDYPEIALSVDKSEANCRQVFHRARQRLAQRQSRFEATREQTEQITREFMRATTNGDVQDLLRLLAEDVVAISDGGGKAFAALRPVHSREKVSRGVLGSFSKAQPDSVRMEEVNGQPAIVATRGGEPRGVLLLDVKAGKVQALYAVVNPDKLRSVTTSAETGR